MPFCPQCNTEVDEQDKFCRKCGLELKKEESTVESHDTGLEHEEESTTESGDTELEYEKEDDTPLIYRSRWYRRLWFGIGIATGIVLVSLGLPPSTNQKVAFLTSGVALLAAILVWFRSRQARA
jgi:hypothetical protein